MNQDFERVIQELTEPLNNQYPRPWMTKLKDPSTADTFIVGKNHRNGYPVDVVGSHKRHLDALYNRNDQGCRALYDEVTGGVPSPTRQNTDRFVSMLEAVGVGSILETNVICYSSPMSADLRLGTHAGGSKRGEEIFRFLLSAIKPKALIVHGAGASKQLASILGGDLGSEPISPNDLRLRYYDAMLIVVIRSLAPPAYNRWSRWAAEHLQNVSRAVANHLR